MAALATAVHQGKALYVGISSYSSKKTKEASLLLRGMGIKCLIHQPSYSMLNRWIEAELLATIDDEGMGCIVFSPLAQGLLSGKYLTTIPPGSRKFKEARLFRDNFLSAENLERVRNLNAIAESRGQTLAQMAIAWTLRHPQVSSALIGVSQIAQLEENIGALRHLEFSPRELADIDLWAVDSDINIWAASSNA